MTKLRIKNFGPIGKGATDSKDGFIDISNLTLFVGSQGAGKSTVAKLFSSLCWVEKAVLVGKKTTKEVETLTFLKNLLSYQRIESFLKDESEVEYISDFIHITLGHKKLSIKTKNAEKYIRPQIQYLPSERNLVGIVDRFAQLPLLPDSMQGFLYVYDEVINSPEVQNSVLPIENLSVHYNKRKNKVELQSERYTVSLNEAASGFQSAVPLFLVTKYFIDTIKKRRVELKFKNVNEQKEFEKVLDKNKAFNSYFVNIIEEPEQNLFPNSQKNIIQFLLSSLNEDCQNKLILTTHSPYILETINNSIYAASLQEEGFKVDALVREQEQIDYDKVSAYVVKNGEIHSIKADDIMQIDPKEIDGCSEEINTVYSKLSEMEFSDGKYEWQRLEENLFPAHCCF